MPIDDHELREAASNRGLKLVKSRKRKPGVGDYGHFGLTDAAGKPLLGIGNGVLTATSEEIADYLREGEVSTWAESARTTPDRPKAAAPPPPSDVDDDDAPSVIRSRPKATPRPSSPEDGEEAKAQRGRRPSGQSEKTGRRPPQNPASPKIKHKPAPAPELSIRSAKPADAQRLISLFSESGSNITESDLRRAISAASRRKEPVLVAVRDGLIGFLAWHVIPTLLDGEIARITAIAVDEDERHRGIGRALFEAAGTLFAKQKVARVEIMSDISVRNVNGFYRAMGLEQTSYRFSKFV